MRPLAITPEQAQDIRAVIDKETAKDSQFLDATVGKATERLGAIQEKLDKLTRGYLDEIIDQESYQAAKADLVLEKTRLKREKEQLRRTRSSSWTEPAQELVNTLETAGKLGTGDSPQEISKLVLKVGTNRLITSKKVAFGFSEHYEFAASLLGEMNRALSDNPSLHSNADWQRAIWCA